MTTTTLTISTDDALQLVAGALLASNVSEANALVTAHALVAAQIDGQQGHGFSRVPSYCAQARSGKVNGHAIPRLHRAAPSYSHIDAANGFAFSAIDLAIETLVADAQLGGIAAVSIHRSHHCGQLGAHVERLAQRGIVAIMVANTPKAMAPWGGNQPLFGTNPIAFAAPRGNDLPLVIDLSLSRVARGKVLAAKQAGDQIPADWALDASGQPTTDPDAALAGSMLPAGDAKGAALALMVEVLAATITGANRSDQASSFFDGQGEPPGVGQMMIGINVNTAAVNGFEERLDLLLSEISNQPGARLPGQHRSERRDQATHNGVSISGAIHDELMAITQSAIKPN